MHMQQEAIREAAEKAIAEKPGKRVLHFDLDGKTYWIKRKLGNGRNQLVKYSVEKEFYYEIARMTIAAENCPGLTAPILVLTPSYMVTASGGDTLKKWLGKDIPETDKENILREAGAALARLHKAGIVHGRPALRDITWNGSRINFLDWENRLYSRDPAEQKAIDYLLLLQGLYRENFREEDTRIAAVEQGYLSAGGGDTVAAARSFLKKHSLIGTLTRAVAPFHWKDVEPVRKLYAHLVWGR